MCIRDRDDIKKQLKIQTIGHDKVNQLRHVRFFKDIHGMVEHMRKHANILRPKFEAVENILDRELGGLEIGTWTKPHGGYFISFDSLNGCAKEIVAKCKKAGVVKMCIRDSRMYLSVRPIRLQAAVLSPCRIWNLIRVCPMSRASTIPFISPRRSSARWTAARTSWCPTARPCLISVSYTHLDVYKRQI